MDTKERKIGEIFEHDGEWYQCLKSANCDQCAFNSNCIDNPSLKCSVDDRTDNCYAIFKKLEKWGEPYAHYCPSGRIIYFQRYKIFNKSYSNNTEYIMCDFNEDGIVSIELKPKEDMEEKKQCDDTRFRVISRAKEHLFQATNIAEDKKELEVLDSFLLRCWQMGWLKQYEDAEEKNLKPFDLEAAKAGKPVCTRDGRKARIVCFNRESIGFPIIALIKNGDTEGVYQFDDKGRSNIDDEERSYDLMMLHEKKEGWINIYNADTTFYYADGRVFETKDEAVQEAKEEVEKEQREKNEYIDTIRVEWEE